MFSTLFKRNVSFCITFSFFVLKFKAFSLEKSKNLSAGKKFKGKKSTKRAKKKGDMEDKESSS